MGFWSSFFGHAAANTYNEIKKDEKETQRWNDLFRELGEYETKFQNYLKSIGCPDVYIADVEYVNNGNIMPAKREMDNLRKKCEEYISLGGQGKYLYRLEDIDEEIETVKYLKKMRCLHRQEEFAGLGLFLIKNQLERELREDNGIQILLNSSNNELEKAISEDSIDFKQYDDVNESNVIIIDTAQVYDENIVEFLKFKTISIKFTSENIYVYNYKEHSQIYYKTTINSSQKVDITIIPIPAVEGWALIQINGLEVMFSLEKAEEVREFYREHNEKIDILNNQKEQKMNFKENSDSVLNNSDIFESNSFSVDNMNIWNENQEELLRNLNNEQLEAVITTEGYVRVIAGAGSGKTKALTHRYAYLVNELGVSTSNILCVTFTNKAANEMKKRIRGMIGDNDTGFICTFHGFCVQLLREDIHVMNYPQNFVVMDSEDTETILKNVYETSNIQSRSYTFNMARDSIRKFKTGGSADAHIPYFLELDIQKVKMEYENESNIEKKIILGYLYEQRKCYGLDFDDLITFAVYILSHFPEKQKKWQERMQYVMVDEFQDVSKLNYILADLLSGYHKNLFIVGDPDQTIYSWRGATIRYIMDFDKKHENTKTIILNKNYRSTPNILNSANSLIKKNKDRIEKDLVAMKDNNVPVTFYHAKTTKLEAEWIAKQIKTLHESGKKYTNIAILYRAHFVSRSIEEIFMKEKIPYILYSGIEFYRRKEIKDILSYLRMVLYADDLSFQRVINEPRRNIGKKRIAFLKEYAELHSTSMYNALKDNLEDKLFISTDAAAFVNLVEKYNQIYKEMKVSDLMTVLLAESGYESMLRQAGEEERLDNLSELKQSIFDFEKTAGEETSLEEYIQNISLFTNSDKDENKDAVKMMTVHTAKGLEFPYVFVCGLNEGIFPNKHVDTIDKLEEERRLAYVAYTRAENVLFLSDAEGVNYDGSFRYPSRFIFNTDREYLNYVTELEEKFIDDSRKYIQANEERISLPQVKFQIGDYVEHKIFGIGKIIGIKKDISSFVIKFEQSETERNINFNIPLTLVKK